MNRKQNSARFRRWPRFVLIWSSIVDICGLCPHYIYGVLLYYILMDDFGAPINEFVKEVEMRQAETLVLKSCFVRQCQNIT